MILQSLFDLPTCEWLTKICFTYEKGLLEDLHFKFKSYRYFTSFRFYCSKEKKPKTFPKNSHHSKTKPQSRSCKLSYRNTANCSFYLKEFLKNSCLKNQTPIKNWQTFDQLRLVTMNSQRIPLTQKTKPQSIIYNKLPIRNPANCSFYLWEFLKNSCLKNQTPIKNWQTSNQKCS